MKGNGHDLAELLPDYDLGDEAGRGQYGIVWRARHRQLQRDVAVKQLTATNDEHAARFRREARILAQVDHPHVVRVFDYREAGDLRLIVMELLPGGTLAQRVQRGITTQDAIAATLAGASGLHEVHLQGILHRDVKPENLMFDGRGTLKVTDFGVARDDPIDSTAMHVTQAGVLFGTPAFVSPEQAGAALAEGWPPVSPATDQYSLAAVLYQALSGHLTHDDTGGAVALCTRRLHEEARPLGHVAPAVPVAVADTVMRALRRDPAERYPTCEDFGIALALAARGLGPDWLDEAAVQVRAPGPILNAAAGPAAPTALQDSPPTTPQAPTTSAEPAPPAPSGRRPRRRRTLVAIAVCVVALVGAAAVAVTRWQDHGSQEPATQANREIDLVKVWDAETGGGVYSSPTSATLEGGREVVVVGSKDGSVYAFDAATGEEVWEQSTEKSVWSSPTVVGEHVYIGSDDGYLYDLNLEDGSVRWDEFIGATVISSPVVADGVVVVGADDLYAFDAVTGEPRWEYPTGEIISSPVVDDGVVYVGSDDGHLYAVGLDEQLRWSYDSGAAVRGSPVVADNTVFVGNDDGSLVALRTSDKAEVWNVDLGAKIRSTPLVSGDRLVVGTGGGRLVALDHTSGAEEWTFNAGTEIESSPLEVAGLAVFGADDGRVYAVWLDSGDGAGFFATDGTVQSSPTGVDGDVVVGSEDGFLYRIAGFD